MKLKHVWKFLLMMITLLTLNATSVAAAQMGHLDSVEGDTVSGWAWDNEDPQADVEVKVTVTNQVNGQVVAEKTATTSIYRSDLDQVYGDGSHGFTVTIPWDQMQDGIYRITAATSKGVMANSLIYQKGDVANTGRYLGVFKTTAYCPCYICSEGWGRQTSSGALATASHTVAVDKRIIPMGSKLLINGTVYTVEDVGGGVKGNHIDIYFNTHGETRQYGKRNAEVFLLP